MLTSQLEIESLADHALRQFFEHCPEALVCVYLYGSRARGTAGQASDVDLAVLYAVDPPDTLEGLGLDLAADLEQRLGQTVDLLVLNRAPVDLIHRVLRDGVLVCERDRSARIRFEVRKRNDYFDLLPYLRQYRRAAREPVR
jgi:predicted nucleotidyltransferase